MPFGNLGCLNMVFLKCSFFRKLNLALKSKPVKDHLIDLRINNKKVRTIGPFFYKLLSINSFNCVFDKAPTFVSATAPSLNSNKVGIPRIPYLGGVFEF